MLIFLVDNVIFNPIIFANKFSFVNKLVCAYLFVKNKKFSLCSAFQLDVI